MKNCIDFYDDLAESWAEVWYKNEQMVPYIKRLISLINKKEPRILDLCCGAGYESMRLCNLGAKVVGIDLSSKSIEIAKNKNPNISFYVKDMLKPYTDLGKFDGMCCIAGIVHLNKNELETAFKNMYDVLNKNAYLLLVFREGAENKLTTKFNDEIYARNFIYHSIDEISKYIIGKFSFVEDLTQKDDDSKWKYCIYKKI